MTIKPLLLAALDSALNHYLSLDDNIDTILSPLAGKIVAVTITPFNQTFYLCPTTNRIQVLDTYIGDTDTHITGSLASLGLMGLSGNPANFLFSGEVKIDGDIHTGQKFQDIFKKLNFKLEHKLAKLTGENVAHNIAEAVRSSKQWSEESLRTFKLNASEFLQEETRDLPAKPEADEFYNEVDELRLAFDRLENRIARLENKNAEL